MRELQGTGDRIRQDLEKANELCARLKEESILCHADPSASSRTAQRREGGTQTRYISERTRLREQVDALRHEVARISGASNAGAPAGTSAAGLVGSWLSLCLRPARDDNAPASAVHGPPPAPALVE